MRRESSRICKSFANYGFPEIACMELCAHRVCDGWLKAHYPTEFYAALLNSWPMGFYPPSTLIHDAKRHGVVVRPPCMRDGEWECTIEPMDRGSDHNATKNTRKFMGSREPDFAMSPPEKTSCPSCPPWFLPRCSKDRLEAYARSWRKNSRRTATRSRWQSGSRCRDEHRQERSGRARKAETLETLTALSMKSGNVIIPIAHSLR